MFGALYVVQSKDEYAVNPAEYVNVNGLRIQDPLLAMTVSQTEWTTNDFAEAMNEFQKGRDFAAGRQMFTAANCIACHKMNGQGREFGPDLLKLDPKWDATEILVHLIEPSKKIDDKYKTQTFLLASGKTISGIVMEEDEKVVKLVENPMVKTDIVEVDKRDIEDRNASDISIMPKGLLDTLTVDEVLNLLAYVTTKGDESAPIFKVQQK
jgi:putative heme-binding domain-containing protein